MKDLSVLLLTRSDAVVPVIMAALSVFLMPSASAEEWFNPAALSNVPGSAAIYDQTLFSVSGEQPEGVYRADIYVNDLFISSEDVEFYRQDKKLVPVLSADLLRKLPVKTEAFPALAQPEPRQPIGKYIPDARAGFDFSRQRLDFTLPQAALQQTARGFTDPRLWDQGINAAYTSYSFTQSENKTGSRATQDAFLSLRNGINFGAWRLRNYATWSHSATGAAFSTINTYLQRDIQALKGQLALGDSATPADLFESFQFRGIQLSSDDNMLPDSMRGFAPVIRGIAYTNAQVTIKQNQTIIYQTYVAPGSFVINDLYPTTSSGNLEVIIKEASGQERHFTQSFSAAPVMLREHGVRYSATVGQYRSTSASALKTQFGTFSLTYGLPHNFTVYGGSLTAENYLSAAAGAGYSMGVLGAMSADVTQARTRFPTAPAANGRSYRVQYAKSVNSTGTSVTLASYRYTTKGFYDFADANSDFHSGLNRHSKTQLTLSQNLGSYGSIALSAYQQDYWARPGHERSSSIAYNTSIRGINYSLNYARSESPGTTPDRAFAFSVSVPLSRWLSNSWATYAMNTTRSSGMSQQVGLSGNALADNNLAYNFQQSRATQRDSGEHSDSGYASLDYKGTYARSTLGYSYGRNFHHTSLGVQGGIIAHDEGITLSQPLGDTFALVKSPGAAGVNVFNNAGVRTDWRGYTAVPYLSTYRATRISLDPESLNDDTEIETLTQTVIPTKGAIVVAAFPAKSGKKAIITLRTSTGVVPFGAQVQLIGSTPNELNSSIAGSDGQTYMAGLPPQGQLSVKWGEKQDEQCRADYVIPPQKSTGVAIVTATCR